MGLEINHAQLGSQEGGGQLNQPCAAVYCQIVSVVTNEFAWQILLIIISFFR